MLYPEEGPWFELLVIRLQFIHKTTLMQKTITGSLAIDLQGLTKVEARIVVLAVWRMINEKYNLGAVGTEDRRLREICSKRGSSGAGEGFEVTKYDHGCVALIRFPRNTFKSCII